MPPCQFCGAAIRFECTPWLAKRSPLQPYQAVDPETGLRHMCDGVGIVNLKCDMCSADGALPCHSYYDEEGRDIPFDGNLCAACHHGGPKSESLERTSVEKEPVVEIFDIIGENG